MMTLQSCATARRSYINSGPRGHKRCFRSHLFCSVVPSIGKIFMECLRGPREYAEKSWLREVGTQHRKRVCREGQEDRNSHGPPTVQRLSNRYDFHNLSQGHGPHFSPFFLYFGDVFTLPSLKAMLRLEREDMKTKRTQGREEGLSRAHPCQPDPTLSRTAAERKR